MHLYRRARAGDIQQQATARSAAVLTVREIKGLGRLEE